MAPSSSSLSSSPSLSPSWLLVLAMLGSPLFAAEPAADPLRLLLPEVVCAVPGVETNIYFDNICLVLDPDDYLFDVTCDKGAQQAERWTYTPAADDVGVHPLRIDVRNGRNEIIAHAESQVRVSPADAGAGRALAWLMIGDSLTAAAAYPQRVLDACVAAGNPAVTLIGSCGTGANRHEGYGGWTATRFATHFQGTPREGEPTQRATPFMYPGADGKPCLDLARYCQDMNGGAPPDVVTLFLGCNDTFSATDETIDERIDSMFQHYDTLLAMIHGLSKDTIVGAVLLVPPAATQDAFGANYQCGQTRWQYKRNQHRVVERMIAHYGKREAENLFLIPAHLNLDTARNYPRTTTPASATAATEITRLGNGVHPAPEGYRQIGDTLYCWLKARMNQKEGAP
jgi:lysophospholipase L1-like esterase